MNHYLMDALSEWTTTYPRRVLMKQKTAKTPIQAVRLLSERPEGSPGYISVYGFPRGHPRDGNVPAVDTLMFDFDIPSSGLYGRPEGPEEADPLAWKADMTELLEGAINPLARVLLAEKRARFWRASLSGHKGVHFYLDFPLLDYDTGRLEQFKDGLMTYTNTLLRQVDELSGKEVSAWLDVDSSDLSRMTRLPNTLHGVATENFGTPRYCVPVTIEDLTTLTADGYEQLTSEPRQLPDSSRRLESKAAGVMLSKFVSLSTATGYRHGKSSSVYRFDPNRIEQYDKTTTKATAADIPRLLSDRPCMLAFIEDPRVYDGGDQSHQMKLAVLTQLKSLKVSSDEIFRFFDEHTPDHDREQTSVELNNVLRYNYSPWRHETLWRNAPMFCRPDLCRYCRADKPRLSA